mmetsp:Transcript_33858/g.74086  ORF Transcript_33858/g.74086 Transcript_33858/m.74086 type:complete len:429 (+) Transcript_33858:42-1328(+)
MQPQPCRLRVFSRGCVGLALAAASLAEGQRPVCQLAEALVGSVDMHLNEWDTQIEFALNSTHNCSTFLEFVYLSRERIHIELEHIRGNVTLEMEQLQREEGQGAASVTSAVAHMSKASSLVSAHIHIHGALAAARQECLSEHLQLLFLMSMRGLKKLLNSQLRHLWVVFQGTPEHLRKGVERWLTEITQLFEADLRTYESIMVNWQEPKEDIAGAVEGMVDDDAATRSRPGPPLPAFSEREVDGVALSTIEILRRDTFEEWDTQKPLLRSLLRHALSRDTSVADVCAGSGLAADFFNDTGLLTAYAFDLSPNIVLLSKGVVQHANLSEDNLRLWRDFDFVLCLTAARDFGLATDTWAKAWRNIEAHAAHGAVLSCGSGDVRQLALAGAASYAPALRLDEQLTEVLEGAGHTGICAFRRDGAGPTAARA